MQLLQHFGLAGQQRVWVNKSGGSQSEGVQRDSRGRSLGFMMRLESRFRLSVETETRSVTGHMKQEADADN